MVLAHLNPSFQGNVAITYRSTCFLDSIFQLPLSSITARDMPAPLTAMARPSQVRSTTIADLPFGHI
jgi:hypothetical protein